MFQQYALAKPRKFNSLIPAVVFIKFNEVLASSKRFSFKTCLDVDYHSQLSLLHMPVRLRYTECQSVRRRAIRSIFASKHLVCCVSCFELAFSVHEVPPYTAATGSPIALR